MARNYNQKATDEVRQLKRRVLVAQLYLKGTTQAMMAEELGVNVGTVQKDLEACREVWLAKMVEAFSQKKAEELAKLDEVERESWAAWRKSVQDREVVTTRTENMVQPKKRSRKGQHKLTPIKSTTERAVHGQCGDPRFLEIISRIIETRLKIMGVFKDSSSGQTVVNVNWHEMLMPDQDRDKARRLIVEQDPIEAQIREVEARTAIQIDGPTIVRQHLPILEDENEDGESMG